MREYKQVRRRCRTPIDEPEIGERWRDLDKGCVRVVKKVVKELNPNWPNQCVIHYSIFKDGRKIRNGSAKLTSWLRWAARRGVEADTPAG